MADTEAQLFSLLRKQQTVNLWQIMKYSHILCTLHSWGILPIADSFKLLELELLELSTMSISLSNWEKIPAHKNENKETFNPPLTSIIAPDVFLLMSAFLHSPVILYQDCFICSLLIFSMCTLTTVKWKVRIFWKFTFATGCSTVASMQNQLHTIFLTRKKKKKGNVRYCPFPTLTRICKKLKCQLYMHT